MVLVYRTMLQRLQTCRALWLISSKSRRVRVPDLHHYSSRSDSTDQEVIQARKWLAEFDAETIPKSICDLTFSRSSGPGGQNVNKVNSKASMRIPFSELSDRVPTLLHGPLKASPYYARNTDSLLISASDSRKQQDNVQSCYQKLTSLILETGAKTVPGETSDAQRAKVKRLQTADNERRIKMKKMHSSKKSSRRGGWD